MNDLIKDNIGELEPYLKGGQKIHDGVQFTFEFPNGYGASVIRHKFSYGGDRGLWEVAVLDSVGNLCYTTPITDDVLGYLSEEDVLSTLEQIRNL
jgi:hypothetical protein